MQGDLKGLAKGRTSVMGCMLAANGLGEARVVAARGSNTARHDQCCCTSKMPFPAHPKHAYCDLWCAACRRSVVVAIRGTATMEDVVTDSLAEPVLLHNTEWLPKHLRAHQQKTGRRLP